MLAARRLAAAAVLGLGTLRAATCLSTLRPLSSLTSKGGLREDFSFKPLGWDGDAFASHVHFAAEKGQEHPDRRR